MAADTPVIVHIQNKPGNSLGQTMNDIRSWLDHRKIQPRLFRPVAADGGFDLEFHSEDEARLFEREFS